MPVESGQEKKLYDAGFTLYFHSLRSPGMDAWIAALVDDLGLVPGATRVSAFASRRGMGLKAHYDANDNFVCQAVGVKRWRIAPNTHVKNPTVGYAVGTTPTPQQSAEAPDGFPGELPMPCLTVEMEPGTVMFVPHGMWHDTETPEGASLHLNIQCGIATWKDVIEFLLVGTTVLHEERFREPMAALLHDRARHAELETGLKEKLRELIDLVCAGEIDVDRNALYGYVARRRNA